MTIDVLTVAINYGVPGILCLVLLRQNKKQSDEFIKCAKIMAKSLCELRDTLKEALERYD